MLTHIKDLGHLARMSAIHECVMLSLEGRVHEGSVSELVIPEAWDGLSNLD